MTLLMYILQSAVTAFGIATTAATFLAPFLTQITKRYLGVDSLWAYFLHIAFSAGLTAGALALTGEISAGSFAATFGLVVAGSQTLFQLFKTNSGLTVDPAKVIESETPPAE